jgi:hypothetical protein
VIWWAILAPDFSYRFLFLFFRLNGLFLSSDGLPSSTASKDSIGLCFEVFLIHLRLLREFLEKPLELQRIVAFIPRDNLDNLIPFLQFLHLHTLHYLFIIGWSTPHLFLEIRNMPHLASLDILWIELFGRNHDFFSPMPCLFTKVNTASLLLFTHRPLL